MYMCMCAGALGTEKGTGFLGVEVTRGCEPQDQTGSLQE